MICLDKVPSRQWVEDLAYTLKESYKMVFLDHICFQEDNELRLNAHLILKSFANHHNIDIELEII